MGGKFYGHTDFNFDFAIETRELPLAVEATEIIRKETTQAIIAFKDSKAAVLDEIAGEMLKHGGEDLVTRPTKSFSKNSGENMWYQRNGNRE